jgi:hypothetical protein
VAERSLAGLGQGLRLAVASVADGGGQVTELCLA